MEDNQSAATRCRTHLVTTVSHRYIVTGVLVGVTCAGGVPLPGRAVLRLKVPQVQVKVLVGKLVPLIGKGSHPRTKHLPQ